MAGELFPQTQQMQASYTRTNQSVNNVINTVTTPNYSTWYAGPTLSWEIDFWGRYRRAVRGGGRPL